MGRVGPLNRRFLDGESANETDALARPPDPFLVTALPADDGTDDAWTRMTGKYTHVELTDSIKQFDARDGMLAAVQNTNIAIMLLWLVFDYDVPGRAVDCIQPGPVFGARYDIARELLLAVCGKNVLGAGCKHFVRRECCAS